MKSDQKNKKRFFLIVGVFLFFTIISLAGLILIRTNESAAWRFDNLVAKIKYAIAPPEKIVFIPQAQVAAIVSATLKALTPSATSTPPLTTTITPTPGATATSTIIPTAIPNRRLLKGIEHEYQQWNNCGPANLAMILSYWDWVGDQRNTAAYLKPNPRDKNVMPYEMQAYVEENTELSVIIRTGGNIELLESIIAAGFPVLVERGYEGTNFEGWMGHYEVISGYDVAQQKVYAQDSYSGPDLPIPYTQFESAWRAFNYVYLIIFPSNRVSEIMNLLGPQADSTYNLEYTAQVASVETVSLSGRDQFFAWYNRGTSLVNLGDYTGAALAYDEAYKIYPTLEEGDRPWRLIWYQTGPYFAYYYTGRYYDVLTLSTSTLSAMSE
ncbi:MAG: C39 family peptidase, partial [Anaerolineaceae bacterium]